MNSDADEIDAKKTVVFRKLASRWEKMESKRGGFGKNVEKGKKKEDNSEVSNRTALSAGVSRSLGQTPALLHKLVESKLLSQLQVPRKRSAGLVLKTKKKSLWRDETVFSEHILILFLWMVGTWRGNEGYKVVSWCLLVLNKAPRSTGL